MTGSARWSALAMWSLALACLGAMYTTLPVSPDHAVFDYIAWSHLQGAPYYAGVAEQNWPGQMLLHELAIRLFGVHFWTFRLFDFLLLLPITLAGAAMLRRLGHGTAAAVFALLYPAVYVCADRWTAGQRDIVAAGLLLIAASLVAADGGKTPAHGKACGLNRVLAGAIVGYAFLIRPTFLSYLPILMLADSIGVRSSASGMRDLAKRWGWTGVGLGGVLVAALAAGWAAGSLGAFYEQAILFNLQAYPNKTTYAGLVTNALRILGSSWHWLTVFAILGGLLWVARSRERRAQLLVIGLICTILVSYFFQRKGFGYHLEALLLPLCLLCAILVQMLRQLGSAPHDRRVAFGLRTALLGVLLVTAVGSAKKLARYEPSVRAMAAGRHIPLDSGPESMSWQQTVQTVDTIRKGSRPDEPMLQWGRNYAISFLSERRSSTRFVSTPALDLLSDRFAGTASWLEELDRSLTHSRPRFVLIDRSELRGSAPPYSERDGASDALKIVVRHLDGYTPVHDAGGVVLLRRP